MYSNGKNCFNDMLLLIRHKVSKIFTYAIFCLWKFEFIYILSKVRLFILYLAYVTLVKISLPTASIIKFAMQFCKFSKTELLRLKGYMECEISNLLNFCDNAKIP